MCGRFLMPRDKEAIRFYCNRDKNSVPAFAGRDVKTGEVSPDDATVVLAGKSTIAPQGMVWGFPKWNGQGVIPRTRAESALQKNMFRLPLLHNRVAIPTSGYFEWKALPGQGKKDRYLFRQPGRTLLYIAGVYDWFGHEQKTPRFALLTTEATDAMISFHHRMPMLLREEEIPEWLSGSSLEYFLERESFPVEAIGPMGSADIYG